MTAEDVAFAVSITQQEGWGYKAEDMERILGWYPDGCFITWSEGHRLAMATTFFYRTFGWIGNVVVAKDHRGKGVGTGLMKRCISHLKGKGVNGIRLFAYKDTYDFYERMGFAHEGVVRVLRSSPDAPVTAIDAEAPFRVSSLEASELEVAIELDTRLFNGDRARILRTIYDADPSLSLGLWNEQGLRGFIMGKKVLGNIEVGPWMCDLDDIGPALSLLDSLMASLDKAFFLGVPGSNTRVLKALEERGFKLIDRVFGMYIGQPPALGSEHALSVGALEKG